MTLWSISGLATELERQRMLGHTVALCTGCFDVLHAGHVALFAAAADLAETVVVALDADERVTRLKGPGRPVCPLADRAVVVAAIRHVSYVTSFWSQWHYGWLLEQLRPDLLVLGEDHRDSVVGLERVPRVHFVPRRDSSTRLVDALVGNLSAERYAGKLAPTPPQGPHHAESPRHSGQNPA